LSVPRPDEGNSRHPSYMSEIYNVKSDY
jgi:hypothetical protein